MKLDKSKQYGVIHGRYDAVPTAQFTQEGKFFDINGDLIDGNELRKEKDGSQVDGHDGRDDEFGHGHDEADGRQDDAKAWHEKADDDEGQDEEGHVLTPEVKPEPESKELVMDKTDEQLDELASAGIAPLREYSTKFDVNGVSKSDILEGLKALRK